MKKWMIIAIAVAVIGGIAYYFWQRRPEVAAGEEAEPATDFPYVDTPAARETLDALWTSARAKQVVGQWTQSDIDKLRADIAEARGVSSWEELKRIVRESLAKEPVYPYAAYGF